MVHDAFEHCHKDPSSFKNVLEDAEKPLYPGSKHSKLSSLMKLYNIKGLYGWSDSGFSVLLEVLNEILPNDNSLPKSMYEARKIMKLLGLDYEKIHACRNDCILYRNEFENLSECPRLKRMFQSPQTAENLTWHENKRIRDGKLRHPADSPAWQLIDKKWPDFAQEPRNLRFALSSDGINPHSTLSTTYSCWPVTLITYNLPPWLCMKRKFMMLSLLISGPKQPGNDIDVYLAPLIEDLKTLWDVGVDVFDGYRKQTFNLRAVLMWTISDFPAYGNLSGCTVKGYYGVQFRKRGEVEGHNKGKGEGNSKGNSKGEGDVEGEGEGEGEVEGECEGDSEIEGEGGGKGDVAQLLYKKRSIFFDLEYWEHLLVRHQLDVMHIEKNVCESIYGTLLQQPGKTKDGINARKDLTHPDLREKINKALIVLAPDEQNKVLPPAPYTLSKKEKKMFCETLQSVKVPDGYCSNFRNIVSMEDCRLHGLKSHDCHTLMQQLLPLAIRNCLPQNVRSVIIRLCLFFNSLCSKSKGHSEVQILRWLMALHWRKRTDVFWEHLALLQSTHPRQLKKPLWLPTEHSRTFADWLKQKVTTDKANNVVVDKKVWWLANKPRSSVVTYDGYCINGFNFATRDRDSNRITQNSGVYVVANTLQISSSKDKNPHSGDMPFYGVVSEIWQLDYLGVKNVLFKCDWVDDRGVNVDELGFTVVNLDRIGYKSDYFILARHAKQVFYVKDQLDNSKSVVCSVSSKCYYSNEDLCDGIDEYAPLSNNFPECKLGLGDEEFVSE
ncbi:uncharacterized protein LOC112099137 [Citrus clementina]|uniref:uncharacterized protein LOC112099137 n=1 Tax=Citrus clementina TaxID=85681 RepID=UPI000CECFADA|nr:uncharacterized protein LOC112099137 [Citrus x clementina]